MATIRRFTVSFVPAEGASCSPEAAIAKQMERQDPLDHLDRSSGVYNQWQQCLSHLLNEADDDSPSAIRKGASKARELALADPIAARSLLPAQLACVLCQKDQELRLGLSLMMSTLASPLWASCASCKAKRLVARPPPTDSTAPFTCGSAPALFLDRRCG